MLNYTFVEKDVDLLSYWMPVIRKIKEFKEIAKAEEPELRYLIEDINRFVSNMFIESADEYGIARFESMMGIYPDDGADLETRRFKVLVKWNDKVPYTDEELYSRLLTLCGSTDKFQIDPHYEEYRTDITTQLTVKDAFDTVCYLLAEMLPCNLVLNLNNYMYAEKESPLVAGVAISTAMSYQITHDINKEYQAGGSMYYALGVGKAQTHIITHDIAGRVSTVSTLSNAVANSTAFSELITHDVGLQDTLEAPLNGGIGVGIAHTRLITNDISVRDNANGNSTVATPVSTATVITIS